MSISNRERVGRALDILREGLYPFIDREMKAIHGDRWLTVAFNCLPEKYTVRKPSEAAVRDDVG
jgi:Swt1-like HEPN